MLKFSEANAKTRRLYGIPALRHYLSHNRKVYSFDLLSGWSCPFAEACLSKAIVSGGRRKVKDGPRTEFRCFSASQEALLTPVYNLRKHNFESLRQVENKSALIQTAMPADAGVIRIHVAGDFFNQNYFDAWLTLAVNHSHILFYAYTKSLPFWVNRINDVPQNMVLTASYGGRRDDLIASHNLRSAVVVKSKYAARKLRLQVDDDDSHAANPNKRDKSFALLIHGTQPKGSKYAKAWQRIKKTEGGYSR